MVSTLHKLDPNDARRALRVLIVEDNPGDARLLIEYLRDVPGGSYEPFPAETLAEGIKVARESEPNVALLDLTLAEGQGLEALTRFLAEVPDVPVVVLTGIDDHKTIEKALEAGAQDYLPKDSMDAQLLFRTISNAISRQRFDEELRRSQAQLLHAQKMESIG